MKLKSATPSEPIELILQSEENIAVLTVTEDESFKLEHNGNNLLEYDSESDEMRSGYSIDVSQSVTINEFSDDFSFAGVR